MQHRNFSKLLIASQTLQGYTKEGEFYFTWLYKSIFELVSEKVVLNFYIEPRTGP